MKRAILKSTNEVKEFLQDFNTKVFALDTEIESFSNLGALLGISLCDGTNACYIVSPSNETLKYLKEQLQSTKCGKGVVIIGHNLVFDMRVLSRAGFNFQNAEWFDTMVASHLIDENGDKALKDLARKYFPEEVSSIVDYEDAVSEGVNSNKFYQYAINDAIFSFRLAVIFKDLLQKEEVDKLFRNLEMPFLRAILEMEETGVLIDQTEVAKTTKELKQALFDMEIEMLKMLGEKYSLQTNLSTGDLTINSSINFNSTKQLKTIFDKLGIEVTATTKKGNPSLGKATISKLKATHPFVALLEKYKIATKLLTAFFEPLPKLIQNDYRVHPHFNDIGTVTGRLSCSNPNLQQLPKVNENFPVDTRKCFIASPGKKMVAIDYSQQELRIMAHLSNDEKLLNVINNDGDIHLLTARNVFGLDIPDEALITTHPEYEKFKKLYKGKRDLGKTLNFGIAYGMGPHKLANDFKYSKEEAEKILDQFFKGYPELKKAIADCHNTATSQLFVKTLSGRKRRFEVNQWNKLDDKNLRQSFNFLIQSLGADIMRKACVKVLNYGRLHPEYGLRLLMTIHDELVFEVNSEYADLACKDCVKLFQDCANLKVPLLAEGHVGLNYSEVK